jgi:hypothetical protein
VDRARIRAIVDDAIEMIVLRGILVELALGSYAARLKDVDLDELIRARATRALRPVVIRPTEGDTASYVNKLRLDPMLLCLHASRRP